MIPAHEAAQNPRSRKFAPILFFSVWTLLISAAVHMGNSLSSGDDPHYLVMAESLVSDQDVQMRNNYEGQGYLSFYPYELDPHVFPNTFLPIHMVGLSVLIAPAYALGGRLGVLIFQNGLFALLIVGFWAILARRVARWTAVALAAGLCAAPYFFASFTVFPESAASLIVFLFLVTLFELERPRLVYVVVALIGFFPWLHVKYFLILATCDLIVVLWFLDKSKRPRTSVPWLGAAAIIQACLAVGFIVWNRWMGMPVDRGGEFLHLRNGEGILGLFLDGAFGLLPYAPFLVLFAPGLMLVWRSHPLKGLAALLLVFSVYFPPAIVSYWYGGYCLPARFVLPLVPLMWWISCEVFVASPARRWFYALYAMAGTYSLAVLYRGLRMSAQMFQTYPQTSGETPVLAPLQLQEFFPFVSRSNRFDLALAFCWLVLAGLLCYLALRRPAAEPESSREPVLARD